MKQSMKYRSQPKREAAIAELTALAHRLGRGAQLPVFAELCRQLNVSKVTLDRALSELEERNIIHRARGIGIFVSQTARHNVVVLYPRSLEASPFWRLVIESLKIQIKEANLEYSLRAICDNEDIKDVVEQLKAAYDQHLFQGVITVSLPAGVNEPFSYQKIPLVSFGGAADYTVSLDMRYLVSTGVLQLIHKGCQRIGGWEMVQDEDPENGASEQLMRSLIYCELTFHAELSHKVKGHNELDVAEKSYTLAKKVFAQDDTRPDGLVMTNDFVAQGVLRAMSEMGIVAGQQIHIISSANRGSPVLQDYQDRITLLEFNPDQVAEKLVELLQKQMDTSSSVGEMSVVRPSLRLPEK